MLYDVIILGAGPAGLSAALYAGRACLKTLLIEKAMPGGQITLTNDIENYPGQLLEGDAVGIVLSMKQMGLSKAEAIALLEKYWDKEVNP